MRYLWVIARFGFSFVSDIYKMPAIFYLQSLWALMSSWHSFWATLHFLQVFSSAKVLTPKNRDSLCTQTLRRCDVLWPFYLSLNVLFLLTPSWELVHLCFPWLMLYFGWALEYSRPKWTQQSINQWGEGEALCSPIITILPSIAAIVFAFMFTPNLLYLQVDLAILHFLVCCTTCVIMITSSDAQRSQWAAAKMISH